MVKQYGFYFNADICTGCNTCVAACRDKNDTFAPGFKLRRVLDYCGGKWEKLDNGSMKKTGFYKYSVSFSCNHCANPACVKACPSGAMTKDEENGIVYVNQEVCIGCETCSHVCPYSAPRLDPEAGIMRKCDFCRDSLAAGEVPACVGACPMRALAFGELDQLQGRYGTNADLAPLPSSKTTTPSIVIGMPRLYGTDGRVVSADEELL